MRTTPTKIDGIDGDAMTTAFYDRPKYQARDATFLLHLARLLSSGSGVEGSSEL